MTIQILPPQLANQIAAGEVVERPASVVKELVENALDAGATKIDIEIDKGGRKRILIRDDGKGIMKDELALALSRHATSKISCLDDLEAIVSLGFRGEALASISSVARLTLTSKPKEQGAAWSASAEGLDMAVAVKPAAHPNGTSIEVLDLFFNTPARRKFLRADKTEFSHIEQLIKRIALSRPDVTFVLKHNGKVVKRYRGQMTDDSWSQKMAHRIGEVIHPTFIEQSQSGQLHYDDVKIQAWVKQPELCVGVNPAQFAFVNGRMMRDKLLQHAIRQGYSDSLHPEQQPEYVVTVDLPATEVDVNVHPAKHEVRFHESRLVHDLLVRCIQDAIARFYQLPAMQENIETTPQPEFEQTEHGFAQLDNQAQNQAQKEDQDQGRPNLTSSGQMDNAHPRSYQTALTPAQEQVEDTVTHNLQRPNRMNPYHHSVQVSNQQRRAFDNFARSVEALSTDEDHTGNVPSDTGQQRGQNVVPTTANNAIQTDQTSSIDESKGFKLCLIEQQRYAYFVWQHAMYVIDLLLLDSSVENQEVDTSPAPLLVPVRLKLNKTELQWSERHIDILQAHGFELKLHGQFVIIKQVPTVLRGTEVAQTLPALFEVLMTVDNLTDKVINKLLVRSDVAPASTEQVTATFNEILANDRFETSIIKMATQVTAPSILTN